MQEPENRLLPWKRAAKGVRYREHPTRKHGKRRDRYYALQYKLRGKVINEGVGWTSDKVTQAYCEELLATLRTNWKSGKGPQTLAEMRAAGQAQREAEQAEAAIRQRQMVTLAGYWSSQYLEHAKHTKKECSWEKEVSHFKHWLEPELGQIPIVNIGFPQWDSLIQTLHKAGLSQRSREYIAGTLRRILKHAVERGYSIAIPTGKQVGATAPKDNRRQRVISPTEREKILSALKECDICAWRITFFAFLTGCRASEAFNLQWGAVDLDTALATFRDTKNKLSRTIHLSSQLLAIMKELGPGDPADHVFLNSEGRPYTSAPSAFGVIVKNFRMNEGRAPLDRISFHSIRHTVATTLARSLDLRTLMDTLGWRVPAMALRYVHSNEQAQKDALAALANEIS